MNTSGILEDAPNQFQWPLCPQADQWLRSRIDAFLTTHDFARALADRMLAHTSTHFFDWVDHLIVAAADRSTLPTIGFVPDQRAEVPEGFEAFWHPHAQLPRVLIGDASEIGLALKAESLMDFQTAHGLSLPIDGAAYAVYRRMMIEDRGARLWVVERRGGRGYVPDPTPSADTYLQALEDCLTRPRPLDVTTEGMDQTLAFTRRLAGALGAGRTAWIFMEAERRYWQSRNEAGHLQYQRQNRLGLGWANHDHHTFRSSRRCFRWLIDVLGAMGFLKRERFYAGEEAGWGAQVMEQPEAGLVIFADVDLQPEDIQVDFASEPMADLQKPGTIGLWCALHGESLLKAGMHHLEAQFDFDRLRTDLAAAGVQTMNPFSDFPHLRQAFTQGALWAVEPERLRQLHERGALGTEAYERIAKHGAVGSHLENLQRREGFKGFNQKAVSQIIREVNPERQALN